MNMTSKKIVACVDGTSASASVTAYAAWAALQLGTRLEFLHVIDRHPEVAESGDYSGNLVADSHEHLLQQLSDKDLARSKLGKERGRAILETAKAEARAAGVEAPDGRLRHGSLIESLTDMAADIDMVVLGQRHHTDAAGKVHLDHTLESVIRGMKCPVLATLERFSAPSRLMIAFDGSPASRANVERIAKHPLVQGMQCHVVMANDRTEPLVDKMLAWARETLEAQGHETLTDLVIGEPITVLRDYARRHAIDLMVTGAFGHSLIRQLIFGSTTSTLLRTSPSPVLVLR
jgi:nucleotide-binding universal stress UspA family protein